jgi:hypothetical protein
MRGRAELPRGRAARAAGALARTDESEELDLAQERMLILLSLLGACASGRATGG